MRSAFEITAALVGTALSLVGQARAEGSDDGAHGRVDGDVTLAPGVGAVVASGGPRAEGELRLRYLETVGAFATYEGVVPLGASEEPHRVLAGGLELRPLFFYRWLRGLETRRSFADLTLDSLGLELGPFLESSSRETSGWQPGLQLGLGIEMPVQSRATGVWIALHGALRWSQRAMALGSVSGPEDRALILTLTLSWHQAVTLHWVDVSDEAPQ
jgi:hypothetical protein